MPPARVSMEPFVSIRSMVTAAHVAQDSLAPHVPKTSMTVHRIPVKMVAHVEIQSTPIRVDVPQDSMEPSVSYTLLHVDTSLVVL